MLTAAQKFRVETSARMAPMMLAFGPLWVDDYNEEMTCVWWNA